MLLPQCLHFTAFAVKSTLVNSKPDKLWWRQINLFGPSSLEVNMRLHSSTAAHNPNWFFFLREAEGNTGNCTFNSTYCFSKGWRSVLIHKQEFIKSGINVVEETHTYTSETNYGKHTQVYRCTHMHNRHIHTRAQTNVYLHAQASTYMCAHTQVHWLVKKSQS